MAEELGVSDVFAQSIRVLRRRRDWNQQQLADRLTKLGHQAHQTTIGKYETGKRRPTLDDAIAIATALDTDLIYMLDGSWLTEDDDGEPRDVRVKLVNKVPDRFAGGLLPRDVRRWLRGERPLPWQDIYRFWNPVPRDVWLEVGQSREDLATASRAAVEGVAESFLSPPGEPMSLEEQRAAAVQQAQEASAREAGEQPPEGKENRG